MNLKFPLDLVDMEVPRTFQFNTWQAKTDLLKHNNAISELQQKIGLLENMLHEALHYIRNQQTSAQVKKPKTPDAKV